MQQSLQIKFKMAGVPERSKGTGSGPVGVGLRGFESLPLHLVLKKRINKF